MTNSSARPCQPTSRLDQATAWITIPLLLGVMVVLVVVDQVTDGLIAIGVIKDHRNGV